MDLWLLSPDRSTPPHTTQEFVMEIQSPDMGALGLVCTRSFPAMIGTADMMLKSSGVVLVGYEKTGSGYCTAVVRGHYADIRLAVQTGKETAEQFGQYISSMMLPRPLPNLELVLPISAHFAAYAQSQGNFPATGAIGLVETRGFPPMVAAADAMLKSANVELLTYEKTGSGLCTAIVQGRVADVTMAVEAGMYEAERVGELHAIMVIPRPLDDLMRTLPKPQQALELDLLQPLNLPQRVPAKERELVELPQLQKLPAALQQEAVAIEAPAEVEVEQPRSPFR
ncbi:MAG: BMC domain-containing protein, partial [Prochlorothrix sp.]|nr:BMC domain-containing protein [Prochlorothrix sp.]